MSVSETSPTTSARLVRCGLAILSLLSALCVFYLSMIPLRYEPLSWAETVKIFQEIPWLQLGIEKRDDWVANGIIMVPVTFFAAGAIDWGRKSRLPLIYIGPALIILICLFAVVIEFCQIWFPPRVVSLNDLSAGIVGGIVGIVTWAFLGHAIVGRFGRFIEGSPGHERIAILSEVGLWALLLYSFLPFDIILSIGELRAKYDAGRITILPFSDVIEGSGEQFLRMLVFSCPLVPCAIVARLKSPAKEAARSMLIWSVVLEFAQLPVYSRNFSTTSILISGAACLVAIALTPRLTGYFKLLQYPGIWFAGALVWTTTIFVGFCGRFSTVVRDPDLALDRFVNLFAVPFARAQRSTEMQAGENFVLKVLVFAALTFMLVGWSERAALDRRSSLVIAAFWTISVAIGVELGQVFLIPLVPDITDVILYSVGAGIGWWAFCLLVPRTGDRL